MFVYSPKLYELQTWGATGDRGFHLDTHAQTANLLSHKVVHINVRAGSCRAIHSGVTSPIHWLHIHPCPCQPDPTPGLCLTRPA